MKRKATNAGRFYDSSKDKLKQRIELCFEDKVYGPGKPLEIGINKGPRNVLGGVCPHAGYVYSGPAAAHTFQAIFRESLPDTIIVLGTDHVGFKDVFLMQSGVWETPLGDLNIDEELTKVILRNSNEIFDDNRPFLNFPGKSEHNIEVQMPFIKYASNLANKEIKIVPIKIGSMKYRSRDYKTLEKVGNSLANSIQQLGDRDIAVIASSDISHFEPGDKNNPSAEIEARKKEDQDLLGGALLKMDPKETLNQSLKIGTVCGGQTITTNLVCCNALGAKHTDLLKYYCSYDISGGSGYCNYSVGYLSAVFIKSEI